MGRDDGSTSGSLYIETTHPLEMAFTALAAMCTCGMLLHRDDAPCYKINKNKCPAQRARHLKEYDNN